MAPAERRNNASTSNPRRTAFLLATLLLCAYALNVLAGKGNTAFGWSLPHANDVTEFLLVLAAMVCFVTGLLRTEAAGTPPQPR